VRQLCPQLGEGGDPCGVSAETKAELEKLQKDVETLEKKAGRAAYSIKSDNPKGLDAVANASRELDAAYERIFDLRERYFQCDKVYGGLKLEATTLGKARGTLRVAMGKAYKAKLDKFKEDLDSLQKSKEEVDAKVDKLTQFTNDVALDVMTLAQTESVRSSVKVEGVAQSNAENLAKVLQGDREAMDAMIKANPGHFDGQGRESLLRKKDSLERLDQMLTKLAEQGYGERLGFKTAQQEVKATLALVNQVLPPEGDGGPFPWGPLGIGFGVASIAAALFFFWTRREKAAGSPEPSGVRVSLGARKPLGGAPTAAAKAEEPVAAKPALGGGLKLGQKKSILGSKPTEKAPEPKSEEKPAAKSSGLKLGSRPPLSGKFGSKPTAEPKPESKPVAEAKPAPMQMEESTSVSAPEIAMPEPKIEQKPLPPPPPPAPLPRTEAPKVEVAEKPADKPSTPPPAAQKPKLERPGIKLLSRR
jgi:hypothetical protein